MIHIRDLSQLSLICINVTPIHGNLDPVIIEKFHWLGARGSGGLPEMRCNSSEPEQRFFFDSDYKYYHAWIFRRYPQDVDAVLYIEPQRHASPEAIMRRLAKEWVERGNPITELTDEYQKAWMNS